MTAVPAGQSLRCRPRPTAEAIVTPPAGAGRRSSRRCYQRAVFWRSRAALREVRSGCRTDVPGPIEVVEIGSGVEVQAEFPKAGRQLRAVVA